MKKLLYLFLLLVFGHLSLKAQVSQELEKARNYFDQETAEGYRGAISIYLKYENQLSPSQLNTLGFSYWKLEDYKPALKYFELAAAKGDETGKYNSGYNYFNGNGTEVNYQKAYNYLLRVSEEYSGLPETLHMLGHCVEAGADIHGTLGKPNYWGARAYFLSAAGKGHVASMVHLGDYYNNSGKIEANLNEAVAWYTKACELKNDDACTKLANLKTTLASSNQSKSRQNEESASTKKKGDGFLKVLGAINDGLTTYNNARNPSKANQPGAYNTGANNSQSANWSQWQSIDCFPKIMVRVKFYKSGQSAQQNGFDLEFKNGYPYGIEFHFTYGTPADVKELMENLNANHGSAYNSGTHTIAANGTLKSGLTVPYATSMADYYKTVIVYGPFMKTPVSQESPYLRCENGTICEFCQYRAKQAIKYNNPKLKEKCS